MCYISFSNYVKEKNLVLGSNIRTPPKKPYPRNMHSELEIVIEEVYKPYRYNVKVFENGELILPRKPIYKKPEEDYFNHCYPGKDLNEWLSSGKFLMKKEGKRYFYEKEEDYRIMIETIEFIKKTNGKFDLFWIIEE